MTLLRSALNQQAGLVLGLMIGAVLFGGGVIATLTVMNASASHAGDGVVHACVSRYTGQARFMLPGRPPACSAGEVLMELGSGAGAADVEARLSALEGQVPDCLSDDNGTALFTGCNVQIVNGQGTTGTATGTGNLIVGYNENLFDFPRSGSHNLVVGKDNGYSSFGGFVAGQSNTISAEYASVLGGYDNTASNSWSSVSGGQSNTASSEFASVSGGLQNTASEVYASISGGGSNTASGVASSVGGGFMLVADDDFEFLPLTP